MTDQEVDDYNEAIEARHIDDLFDNIEAVYSATHPRSRDGNNAKKKYSARLLLLKKIRLYRHKDVVAQEQIDRSWERLNGSK